MYVTRRGFLKLSGLTIATFASGLGLDPAVAKAQGYALKIEGCTKIPSICHFCSGGCSLLLHIKDGKLIHLEGDPDSAVNEGTLCSKASSLEQVAYSKDRPKTPLYRAPGSDKWESITWEDAIERIAKKTKEIRDKTWVSTETVTNAKTGEKSTVTVNRAEGIAVLGSAEIDNEESYLLTKFARLIGTPYHEHQARI
ncbi:MAG TPA: formate dehydrogenase subunit alpha [Syntrophomonas sp.]|jgi:formate dehydrogenase major subunit|nr:formate dehydrogenase subunit alpha [Syntrophomonas sp.]HCF70834.1 formate dehydrogenase subunit alpha [Syntrophomonas sp.]